MNRALAIYEQYDRQREIAHACCNIGNIHLKKAEYRLAEDFLQRSLNLAERIGDTPLLSVIFHNLGELATYAENLVEAGTLYRRSLELAGQFNDREYLSLWNADLATILLEQGDLAGAVVCVGQALTIGRAIHNAPCIGYALVILGHLRIAQAKARQQDTIILTHARRSLWHALALPGLEAETRTRGRLALAQVSLLLGEREAALQQATQAREEAQHYALMGLLVRCEQLLREIVRE
jgi:tetratricopeptide (TPR) repeat protein